MEQSIKNEQEPQLTLLEQVEVYLKEGSYNYSYTEGREAISCPLHGKNGNWMTFFHMNRIQTVLTITLCLPYVVMDHKKLKIVDLLNRINRTMVLGRMFLDNEDGVISVVVDHLCLSKQMTKVEIELLISIVCRATDKLLVPINMVAFGVMEPALALHNLKS